MNCSNPQSKQRMVGGGGAVSPRGGTGLGTPHCPSVFLPHAQTTPSRERARVAPAPSKGYMDDAFKQHGSGKKNGSLWNECHPKIINCKNAYTDNCDKTRKKWHVKKYRTDGLGALAVFAGRGDGADVLPPKDLQDSRIRHLRLLKGVSVTGGDTAPRLPSSPYSYRGHST